MAATINKEDILLEDPLGINAVELPTSPVEYKVEEPVKEESPEKAPGIELKEPIEFEGKTISFISTDFSRLSGKDLKQIAKEYKMRFRPPPGESFLLDSSYLILCFARINEVDEAFFDRVDGRTYLGLTEGFKLGLSGLGN
jgi:hypothetical protein